MARDALEKDVIKAFLGDDTEFKGVLSFEGTVRIDGKFEGEVHTHDNLIVGEGAEVKAEVQVGTILIQGYMEGDVNATRKIQIASKGKLIGNIHTPALHIEDGAILEGSVSMLQADDKKLRAVGGKGMKNAESKAEMAEKKDAPPAAAAIN